MYGSTKDKDCIRDALAILDYAYSKIPSTKGCMEHINKPESEGGCGAICCQVQNPSVLYIEFINTWNYVKENWNNDEIGNLIKFSLKNYLSENFVKGCVFFDKSSRMCSQHLSRPFSCRTYGIVPDEEFRPRYERLKIINPDVMDQCKLVDTEDGSIVTKKNTDDWWEKAIQAEKKIGIKEEFITDKPHGSYRTYHDHILIHIFGEEHLNKLSLIRVHFSDDEKNKIIDQMLSAYYELTESMKDGTI